MSRILIKEAIIVNEGVIRTADVLISGDRIEKVQSSISCNNATIIAANGLHLIPGMIDDQVHFRQPGLTHKGDIYSESKAAIAGGITSYMDMPNTIPNTTTRDLLEEKYAMAAKSSLANYSFFMGITKTNLEEVLKTDIETVCGISDDGLYFNDEEGILANYPEYLEKLFSRVSTLIALHCEDDSIIQEKTRYYKNIYGTNIPPALHAQIRNEAACVSATKTVLELAKIFRTRLHLLHISTLAEANLLDNNTPIRNKRITAEACVHHLWFSDRDYEKLGNNIKWNPSIKSESDKDGLLQSLLNGRIDIIATDHAPHLVSEKEGNYFQAKSGGPLVQHALLILLEFFHAGKISLEKIVEKTSHHVAEIYRIVERGYIREGYYADLVLIDIHKPLRVSSENLLYKCRWSPFENFQFQSSVVKTFVNGCLKYTDGGFSENSNGMRLQFEKIR